MGVSRWWRGISTWWKKKLVWLPFQVAMSLLVLFLVALRWYYPSLVVDTSSVALVAILVILWILPLVRRVWLPGGAGFEMGEVVTPQMPSARPGLDLPGTGLQGISSASATRDLTVQMRAALRERIGSAGPLRPVYSTLIETAFFTKLETDMSGSGDSVQRYPQLLVNGALTGVSFHAVVRPSGWPGRIFYLIVDAVGGVTRDQIERALRDFEGRAHFADQVLPNAPNRYVLVVISDFSARREKREVAESLVRQTRAAIPSLQTLVLDLDDLPL